MLITIAAVVYLNVASIFLVNLIMLNLGFGFIAYFFSVYYSRIFAHYIPGREGDRRICRGGEQLR